MPPQNSSPVVVLATDPDSSSHNRVEQMCARVTGSCCSEPLVTVPNQVR